LAKEGISFTGYFNCTLRESSILQGTYFTLVDSMLDKTSRKAFVFNFKYNVWMKAFSHSLLHVGYMRN